MRFKRKQFLRLIDASLDGEVERVVIAHKDRFARFAFSLILHLCQRSQCEIVILNTETLSTRTGIGAGPGDHCALFQFTTLRVAHLSKGARESHQG